MPTLPVRPKATIKRIAIVALFAVFALGCGVAVAWWQGTQTPSQNTVAIQAATKPAVAGTANEAILDTTGDSSFSGETQVLSTDASSYASQGGLQSQTPSLLTSAENAVPADHLSAQNFGTQLVVQSTPDNSQLTSLIDQQLDQYLGEGKFRGPAGPQGAQGPAGSSLGVSMVAPGDKVGGLAGSFKYLSGGDVTASTLGVGGNLVQSGGVATLQTAAVMGPLSVAGYSGLSDLGFSDATSTGSLRLGGDLTVNGATTFAGGVIYTGGSIFDSEALLNGGARVSALNASSTIADILASTDARFATINATTTNVGTLTAYGNTNLQGILTSTGESLLNGGARISMLNATSTNIGTLAVFGNSSLAGALQAATTTVVGNFTLQDSNGNVHVFENNTTGNIGINLTSPTSTLTLLQQATATPGITIQAASDGTANLFQLTTSTGAFAAGFTASGGLLMNVASTTALTIQNGAGFPILTVDTTNASTTAAGTFRVDRRSGGNETLFSVTTSTQEILTIKSDGTATFKGNVVIGGTALQATTYGGLRITESIPGTPAFGVNIINGYSGNVVGAGSYVATISGGGASTWENKILCTLSNHCAYSTIGGGYDNQMDSAFPATIAGGAHNRINMATSNADGVHNWSTPVPAYVPSLNSSHSTIAGGTYNALYTTNYGAIGGGTGNVVGNTTASDVSTIAGGVNAG